MASKSPAEELKMQYVNGLLTRDRYEEKLAELMGIPAAKTTSGSGPQPGMTREQMIEHQIKLCGAKSFLNRKEVKELPHILWEDETVEKIAQGFYKGGTGILVASNKRLIFIDKGMLYGLTVEDFPYDKINSIQYKTGLALGNITIFASGNNAVIDNMQKGEVKPFAEYVRARITAISQHASAPPTPVPQQDDMFSKLERLAALKDKGILSEAEFNQQKAKILSGS